MPLLSDLKHQATSLLRDARQWFRQHWRGFTALQLVLLAVIWLGIHPHDQEWLTALHRCTWGQSPKGVELTAGWLSKYGDFPTFNLALTLLLWLSGLALRRPRLQRLAMMSLLAAALAGTTTILVRSALGRTRPQAEVADGFYGPHWSTNFQSCPSGHTTTAFAGGLSLLIAAPEIGVPATAIAASVGWSRMFLKRHYPADVATGIWVALWFAVPLAGAARQRR